MWLWVGTLQEMVGILLVLFSQPFTNLLENRDLPPAIHSVLQT
jgi:hypothetical protein